jgi:hypothetical protein
MTDPNEAEDRAAAERAKLNEATMAMSARHSVINARVADLAEVERAARARWAAAEGELTRAMKDSGAERITAARERERAAYAEVGQIGREARAELVTLSQSGLDNLGRVLDQIGPTWKALDEIMRQLDHPEPEAEL